MDKTDVKEASKGFVNPDGSIRIDPGPMSPEFLANLQRQQSGMPPVGAGKPATADNRTATVPVVVARNALNKHMDVLKDKIANRENMPDPYRFAGNGNPYMGEMIRQRKAADQMAAAETERLKAELDSLGNLTDAEVVEWAVKGRRVARHVNGGWVAV